MVIQTKFTREEAASALRECLSFLSRTAPAEINEDMNVLRDWDLDSEHGVELACDLSTRLGIEIPENENPLIDESGPRKRARNFGQVLDYLMRFSMS